MPEKKSNAKYHLRAALFSAVSYGLGFIIGAGVTDLLFTIPLLDRMLDSFDEGRALFGILLALLVTGTGGALAGAIGGATLSYAHKSTDVKRYMWRSALGFAIGYAVVAIPLTLAFSMMAFYELADTSPIALMIPLTLMGAVFGLVCGFTLGILTVDRHTWRVVLVAVISFALGGGLMGRFLFSYLLSVAELNEHRLYIYGGLFVFGAVGGGSLGFLYSWLAHRRPVPAIPTRFAGWFQRQSRLRKIIAVVGLVALALVLRALWLISPFTAFDAPLSTVLESRTIDAHFLSPVVVAENAGQPVVFASTPGKTALAWVKDGDIYLLSGANREMPVNISNSQLKSDNPQIVVDDAGNAHIIWTESNNDIANILYSQCADSGCTVPFPLSSVAPLECLPGVSPQNSHPTLAMNPSDTLMAVWRNGEGNLLYSTWSAANTPPSAPIGCIPDAVQGMAQEPRVVAKANGAFNLVFSNNDEIHLGLFDNNSWSIATEVIGAGVSPEVFVAPNDQVNVAWCGLDQTVNYKLVSGQVEGIAFPGCAGRPELAIGGNNAVRLVWYADEVENVLGVVNPNTLIYESFETDNGWTDPAIISKTGGLSQPEMAVSDNGTLHLTWAEDVDEPGNVFYTIHAEYNCDRVELSSTGQAVIDALQLSDTRPETDIIPYCFNQFETFLHAPNPVAAYSDAEPTPNGTFDKFADLAKTAEYEVVFATMWYDSFSEDVNPGRVLGAAIAELYENLKADPSRYPRGITVRLLLGNPPSFALFPTFNSQETALMNDLYAAGVPELRNDEIGWNVEVGRFSGSWPHSHTKLMVVDGKTVQAVGYNMQHSHLPKDHPSGKGKGRVDLGMQITGPVAQSALRAFDDLWEASTHIYCTDIKPDSLGWLLSCTAEQAVADHVPEVLRYYIPDNPTSNAFRIYRTQRFREGDATHASALASATESIDTIHINFSLDLICALNIFIEACNYNNSLDYMQAIMHAIEENDVKARILVSDVAWVGVENNIAIKAFEDELELRGLSDNVEIRYFEQDMHIKSALIDNEFLILGNQNFHYSAWGGSGSLAEFNLGVEDPQMVEDYQTFFNYYWDRAKRREQ